MYRRVPARACEKYNEHGDQATCDECQENFRADGSKTQYRDMPPRATFGRGWFSVGATHWFEATDATLFPSRDGRRILTQGLLRWNLRGDDGMGAPSREGAHSSYYCANCRFST
jgi:hypothetical protein